MFKLSVAPFFWQEVKHELTGDMGAKIPMVFKAKFRRPDQDEVEDIVNRLMAMVRGNPTPAPGGQEAAKPITDEEIVREYLLDWDDLQDEQGQPLAFTPDNLMRIKALVGARGAIVKTFLDNYMPAAGKNSAAPRTTSTG